MTMFDLIKKVLVVNHKWHRNFDSIKKPDRVYNFILLALPGIMLMGFDGIWVIPGILYILALLASRLLYLKVKWKDNGQN